MSISVNTHDDVPYSVELEKWPKSDLSGEHVTIELVSRDRDESVTLYIHDPQVLDALIAAAKEGAAYLRTKVVCSWCKVHLSGPEEGNGLISHGICEPCKEKMEKFREEPPVDPEDALLKEDEA